MCIKLKNSRVDKILPERGRVFVLCVRDAVQCTYLEGVKVYPLRSGDAAIPSKKTFERTRMV